MGGQRKGEKTSFTPISCCFFSVFSVLYPDTCFLTLISAFIIPLQLCLSFNKLKTVFRSLDTTILTSWSSEHSQQDQKTLSSQCPNDCMGYTECRHWLFQSAATVTNGSQNRQAICTLNLPKLTEQIGNKCPNDSRSHGRAAVWVQRASHQNSVAGVNFLPWLHDMANWAWELCTVYPVSFSLTHSDSHTHTHSTNNTWWRTESWLQSHVSAPLVQDIHLIVSSFSEPHLFWSLTNHLWHLTPFFTYFTQTQKKRLS